MKKLGKRLSDAQLHMLGSVRLYGDPWARVFGSAAHGGAISTFRVIERAKLVRGRRGRARYYLTPAGRKAEKTCRLPA